MGRCLHYIVTMDTIDSLLLSADDERAQLPPSPPGSITSTGFDNQDDDSEDDDDALRMLSIVFASDSSDDEGRRTSKKKRRRKRRGVMWYTTPEGERLEMTPLMSTWYNMYVANPDFDNDRFHFKFRRRFRMPYASYKELVSMASDSELFQCWAVGAKNSAGNPSSPLSVVWPRRRDVTSGALYTLEGM